MSPAVSSHSPMVHSFMERGRRKSELLKRRSNTAIKQPTVDFVDGDDSSDETMVVPETDTKQWDPSAPKGKDRSL